MPPVETPLGPFGAPPDAVSWFAVAVGAAALVWAPRVVASARRSWVVDASLAAVAFALSVGYVAVYLRGGPRVIDATTYWLQGRALATGDLVFAAGEPPASVHGRFLLRHPSAEPAVVTGIFPPGYPAVLALGFAARAPLLVGPLLAAALVLVTLALARRALGAHLPGGPADTEPAARLAALLSVSCAALRYHTADTMSHAWAATCFAGAIACALDAVPHAEGPSRPRLIPAGGAGLLAGWLVATRPVTALALGAVLAALLVASARRGAFQRGGVAALVVALGALPGVTLLALHQRAATGSPWISTQALYYLTSDGPPGCFRYGFGAGIGCRLEHGDFLHGFGGREGHDLGDALLTTARRLKLHLGDVANAEPLVLFALVAAARLRDAPAVRLLLGAVIAQVVAYAPFYFDGSYPGGGARLFADVLPVEHVLVAAGAASWPGVARAAGPVMLLACWGFALHASHNHLAFAGSAGGRPMYEPSAAAALPRGALVFVDSDHGFNLGHAPRGDGDLEVLRWRGDDHDRLAWESRGRPPAFRYRFDWGSPAAIPRLERTPFAEGDAWRFEGESLWPPLAQRAGWVEPNWTATACASSGRWLVLHGESEATALLELPRPGASRRLVHVAPRVGLGPGSSGVVRLHVGERSHAWPVAWAGPGDRCLDLEPVEVAGPSAPRLELVRGTGTLALDAVHVTASRAAASGGGPLETR